MRYKIGNIYKILLYIMLGVFATSAVATNMGSVNPNQVLKHSKAWVQVKQQIDSYAQNIQDKVIERQQKLEQEWNEIKVLREDPKNRETLVEKEKLFMEKSSSLQEFVQSAQDTMESAYIDARNLIQNTIFDIVQDIAEQKNLDVVITETEKSFNSPYMYLKPSISLNTQVIEILNQKLPEITLKIDA